MRCLFCGCKARRPPSVFAAATPVATITVVHECRLELVRDQFFVAAPFPSFNFNLAEVTFVCAFLLNEEMNNRKEGNNWMHPVLS